MNQSTEEKNKTLVLNAFETLFNKRDYAVAERYWSPEYIQQINPTVTPCSDVDLVLDLKTEAAERGFKIGVLAGAILAGNDARTVDKFARGLVFDLSCHPGLIKKPPKTLFG
jgi:hypothetical protein